jgi:hypothetical protein
MDKVQKHDSFKCSTPLSEPFRIYLYFILFVRPSFKFIMFHNFSYTCVW